MESIEMLFQDLENENHTRFSLEQIQSFTSNFSVSLGSGAFGDVYKGILHTGVHVAVKVIKGELVSEGIKDQFKAEVSVLCKTHHRNLVKLYGFCFEHNMKALIYEFMENESLDKLLYENQTIEWEILLNIVTGAANGLSYLHKDCEPRIIHYDIKPSNILLNSKFSPKLGDFGLAKLLNQDKSYITESRLGGTPNYIAPELWRRRYLVGEGQKWFPSHVWTKIEAQQHEELLKECGIEEKHREEAKRILLIALHCVQFVPEDRPSMSRVLRLLKGTEHVETPPNPFLYLGSSSRTRIGSSSLTIKFDYPSEILTKVTGYYGPEYYVLVTRAPGFHLITHLRSLCFFANKKKHGPFGYEEGTYFTSGKDGKVVGFHGRSSEFLDAIGLHMEYSNV